MSKINSVVTRDEILTYAEKDTVIYKALKNYNVTGIVATSDLHDYYQRYEYNNTSSGKTYGYTRIDIDLTRMTKNTGRICGYVIGTNDDGSEKIALLGNNYDFKLNGDYKLYTQYNCANTGQLRYYNVMEKYLRKMWDGSYQFKYDWWELGNMPATFDTEGYCYTNALGTPRNITVQDALLGVIPTWQDNSGNNSLHCFETTFCSKGGVRVGTGGFNNKLTVDKDTTLVIGEPYNDIAFPFDDSIIHDTSYIDIGGAIFELLQSIGFSMGSALGGAEEVEVDPASLGWHDFEAHAYGSYAGYCKVFNVVLTKNYEEAIRYVESGVLPTDAYLYPYDVDNIPINETGGDTPPDPEPPAPEPPEDGDIDDNITPTPTDAPTHSPQSLTNNNLYWLSSAQLKRFIDWFWTDATDIASLGDLWDKIRGLYENLAESIIAIRYMPVSVDWIGGTGTDTKIIVGMIQKDEQVLTINKSVPQLRRLGTFDVKEKFKAFTDYSPYTNIMLWLPFHGFIDLDIDMTQDSKIAVECAYDLLSGTIQYFIKRGGYNGAIINSCISKIAVDIPITLQTKNQRDSTIFQNVANATANLIGAGVSLGAGNPIGLTMAMSGFAGTQTQGAPLSLKGTIGESGSFYQPQQVYVYIKHPSYNRPTNSYANHVGYPCNGSYKISDGIGFIQVYNPHITFNKTKNSDNLIVKPYQSEIDEIYSILEKGAYA